MRRGSIEKLRESNRMTTCAYVPCRRLFAVCRRCDSGRRYCTAECSGNARLAQQREASRIYQSTDQGRLAHARRQARYRERKREVTHQPVAGVGPEVSPGTSDGLRSVGSQQAQPAQARPRTCGSRTAAVVPRWPRAGSAPSKVPLRRPPCCAFCEHDSGWLRHMSLAEALRPHVPWPWRRE